MLIQNPVSSLHWYVWLTKFLILTSETKKFSDTVYTHCSKIFSDEVISSVEAEHLCKDLQHFATQISDYFIAVDKPKHAIMFMMRAIRFLAKDKLSNFHSEFVKLCLKADCFAHCLPIISRAYTDIMPDCSAIGITTFYYYSGLIFTGLKRFTLAASCFERVLTLPTKILHQVHVEATKKLQLLSLIQGKTYTLPSKVPYVL